MTQTLHLEGRFPGLNEIVAAAKGFGGRGFGYSKMKKELTEQVSKRARDARLQPVQRARFTFVWSEPNRRRDPDNFCGGGRKFILDGLVDAGVIPEDGWDEIASWRDEWVVGPAGVDVLIDEVLDVPSDGRPATRRSRTPPAGGDSAGAPGAGATPGR